MLIAIELSDAFSFIAMFSKLKPTFKTEKISKNFQSRMFVARGKLPKPTQFSMNKDKCIFNI